MTEKEAQAIVHAALRCGALSAVSRSGVVQIVFQAFDFLMEESAFASVTLTQESLSISEWRSNRTQDAVQWERALAPILEGLDKMRMNLSRPVAA
jgi:hypothetical protein